MAVRSLLLRRPLVGVNPTSLDEYSMFGIVASAPLSIKYSAVPVPVNTPTISHALAFRPIPISALVSPTTIQSCGDTCACLQSTRSGRAEGFPSDTSSPHMENFIVYWMNGTIQWNYWVRYFDLQRWHFEVLVHIIVTHIDVAFKLPILYTSIRSSTIIWCTDGNNNPLALLLEIWHKSWKVVCSIVGE